MLDFLSIRTRPGKRGVLEVYPEFLIIKSKDLMIRGKDFYAIWLEDENRWSDDEDDVIRIIDNYVADEVKRLKGTTDSIIKGLYMRNASSGIIDAWHKYCQKQSRDKFKPLDEKIVFLNDVTTRKDYSSKRLSYPIEQGDISAYKRLMGTLYSEKELEKIEWAIGSVITGDSKYNQKFLVFYGAPGTGKSTMLNIIQKMFDGYWSSFDAKAIGSNGAFAMETLRKNPLIAIQHDGDLSRIEDNTRLNSIVSHEIMSVNVKYQSPYDMQFISLLMMGTNKPVKISDAKSGILRRLIDVNPTGVRIPMNEYMNLYKQIDFELGAIAYHCKEVYLSDPNKYDDYIPLSMMSASNDFYNFIEDNYDIFKANDSVTRKEAFAMYTLWCSENNITYPLTSRIFGEELKNYFEEYYERYTLEDGSRVRSYYKKFTLDKLKKKKKKTIKIETDDWLQFNDYTSTLDDILRDCPAQPANDDGTPFKKWANVATKLKDISTNILHYVKVPENHIVIDFDIKDETGTKSFKLNREEALKWPKTYAELSKSGAGMHLHYIYRGDVSKLSSIYAPGIEIKVFKGDSSLRRMVSKCCNNDIASLSSGLPLKEESKMISKNSIASERALRTLIIRNLRKEIHPATKPSIDFIVKILDDAYDTDLKYDVTDMRGNITTFAAASTNNASYCLQQVNRMKFKSKEDIIGNDKIDTDEDKMLTFYDVEVMSNLFVISFLRIKDSELAKYKNTMPDFNTILSKVKHVIDPKPEFIEQFFNLNLVGFNNRRYDNHIMYGRYMGYDDEQLYKLSQKIIGGDRNAFFSQAYDMSYTDIYDYSTKKQSLKKWEIQLGIHHKELGLPWDQPVPEDKRELVASYCDNDVAATAFVWNATRPDFVARKIQVALIKHMYGVNASVNDTTNALSAKIIFGPDQKSQWMFNWRDLSKPVGSNEYETYKTKFGKDYKFRVWNEKGLPEYRDYIPGEVLPDGWSILPFFEGYVYANGKSTYLDQEIGEGGRVYGEPGMYEWVWDGDVSSMHPHSAIFECVFGPKFTKVFEDLVKARVAIKHKDWEAASKLLDGALIPFLNADIAPGLAQALKIVINSIYGLTSASFMNAFRDPNNIDNIVAKRGALFMTLLKSEVEKRGFKVCHIKTDSIKIPNANQSIIDFVVKFGKEYGYSFETEADFERYCLVNNAVYIGREYNSKEWIATGAQFAVPYVYKTLFTRESIMFEDFCETKSVAKGDIYIKRQDGAETFVGRIGLFTPVKEGTPGAGELVRRYEGKDYAITGTKGYLWMESENVKQLELFSYIDDSYYKNLVDEAMSEIGKYGDPEWFRREEMGIPSIYSDYPPTF